MSDKPAVVYSNVWEDPELNRLSLKVNPGENVISITSGGCNSLCLLLEDPGKLISIDLNPAQLAMLEYKKAAIRELSYDDFIESIGVPFYNKPFPDGSKRLALYEKIKKYMPQYAIDFWEDNKNHISDGIMMCGKVEKFFKFYRKILFWLYGADKLLELFTAENLKEQRDRYRNFRKSKWNALHKILVNRRVLSMVKGAHSFAQVEFDDFAANLNRKRNLGMMRFFNQDNFFMCLILLGGHMHEEAMSPYLLRKNYPKLQQNIDKLEVFKGTIGDVLKKDGPKNYDKFNLSNIFEWMDDELFNSIIDEVIEMARPGSRMAWRYTLASPRNLNSKNSALLQYEPELSDKLFKQDKAFIYESFHVYHLR